MAARQYGLPYKGSKSKIAEWVIEKLPRGRRLVDLFAGGCAITHCAMLKGKWDSYLMVDTMDTPQLFLDAMDGRYRDEKRWISRDDFHRLKDTDPYVRICWSFGNDCATYLYGREIEPYKRACHYAVVFNDWAQMRELCPEVCDACIEALRGVGDKHERRIAFGKAVVGRLKELGNWEVVMGNPLYRSCNWRGGIFGAGQTNKGGQDLSLESLQRLQRLESLERPLLRPCMEFWQASYEDYVHEDGDVVYCDPPYVTGKGTDGYGRGAGGFDKAAFCEWARSREYPVYVTEYTMPPDFLPLWSVRKQSTLCATRTFAVAETVWVHSQWAMEMMLREA